MSFKNFVAAMLLVASIGEQRVYAADIREEIFGFEYSVKQALEMIRDFTEVAEPDKALTTLIILFGFIYPAGIER